MVNVTVAIPEPIKEWIDTRVEQGNFSSIDSYLLALVARDQDANDTSFEMTDALREKLDRSRASGISDKRVSDIFAEAVRKFEAGKVSRG